LSQGDTPGLHVLVLAAGASTRLGSPKQLARVRGRPALQSVVATAMSVAGQAVSVVVGAHAADIMPMLARTGASTVVNRRWEEGLSSSIRTGIAALPPGTEAVLLLLGDQVAVTADDLRRLVAAWKGQDAVIVAALYQQAPGVPAVFPRWCFPELGELRGDRGARYILQRHSSRLVHVPMPNAVIDIDTPEDLKRLNELSGVEPEAPGGPDWSAQTWLLPSGLELAANDSEDMNAPHHRPE
jgi:molybdenum cofactor cytidylyltransferase